MELYDIKQVTKISWGKNENSIGYKESLYDIADVGSNDSIIHGGPVAFDIDSKGNIFILDTINSQIQ